ncbi:MAG: ATP-dependent helicase [Planctomycetes bacterium]|nr:ATP-dependent helicase [Planctomycetota bacterium]
MFSPEVTIGPPGCGKTTSLLQVGAELDGGVQPEAIAFVTFGRAARQEVLSRLELQFLVSRARWCCVRTIHSMAFTLLGMAPGGLMTKQRWEEFAELHAYEFSELESDEDDGLQEPPVTTRDDLLRYAYDWCRNRRLDPLRSLGRCPVERVRQSDFEVFIRRYERFKAERELRDFIDMIQDVLTAGIRPPVTVAFLDEMQDLSPLQVAVVEFWFAQCDRSYAAGDDDQAIHQFQGADPTWMHSLCARRPPRILTQSRRVPWAAHALAQRVIGKNKNRIAKEYFPDDRAGRVLATDLRRAMALVDGLRSTFVLARNRTSLHKPGTLLIEAGVPFRVEGSGAPDPLGDLRLQRALQAAELLRSGAGNVYVGPLRDLLAFVPDATGLVAPATRELLRTTTATRRMYSMDELVGTLALGSLVDRIRERGALDALQKLPKWKRRYLAKVLVEGKLPHPQVVLTSIHGSKGREADLVVVIPDMTRATFKEYRRSGDEGSEAETRVFYVAVTRTRDTLVLVEPQSRRHFRFPNVVTDSPEFLERAAIQEFDGGLSRKEAERAARSRGRSQTQPTVESAHLKESNS